MLTELKKRLLFWKRKKSRLENHFAEQLRTELPEWTEQHSRELQAMLAPGQWLTFALVPSPDGNGKAYALSVSEDEFPGSPIIAVTDEKLLAKLRTVRGQFVYRWRGSRTPIYYYEYCKIDPRQRIVPDQR